MRRREVVAALAGVTAARPLAGRTQEGGKVRIGMAEPVSAELNAAYLAASRRQSMVATEAIQAMNSEDKGQVHEEDAGVSRSLAYVYTL